MIHDNGGSVKHRAAFFISDRTGITAETIGLSLISQFESINFNRITLPFVDSQDKAMEAAASINKAYEETGAHPIVFGTIITPEIRQIVRDTPCFYLDFFKTFIPGLEQELGVQSDNAIGKIHSVGNMNTYNTRIDAVNFALNYDDGARLQGYEESDIIIIGVSRCGKTPTCIYLALQYGIQAANYPITEEDLDELKLPKALQPHKKKIFGLSIDPQRLQNIRSERRPNSRYATPQQCMREVRAVEKLFLQENIPYITSTNLSIEELATKILVISGATRRIR
jgi:regulator of PEP synthase PpsR (kinase-PPPase family)